MRRRPARSCIVMAIVTGCLAAAPGAVAASGARSSTRTIVAGTSTEPLAQQNEDEPGEGARVGEGQRVRSGGLPSTGRITGQWIALAVASVLAGVAFVTAATPGRGATSVLAPLRARLVRAASCGYPLEEAIFDVERAQARPD